MKFSIFFLLILVLSSCGGGDNPKDVITKSLHTEQVCKDSNYRYCFLAVDTAGIIRPIHKMDGLIFSFPKTEENEK